MLREGPGGSHILLKINMHNLEAFPQGSYNDDPQSSPLSNCFEDHTYKQLHRPRPPSFFPKSQTYGVTQQDHDTSSRHLSVSTNAKANSLRKRTSKFGLSGLFSRSKGGDSEEKPTKLHEQLEEDGYLGSISEKETNIVPQAEISVFPEATDAMQAGDTSLRHRSSKQGLKTKASFKRESEAKTVSSWDPPPLFQVYPQALKHAKLKVPSLSAESILRLSSNRHTTPDAMPEDSNSDSHASKDGKERKLKRYPATDALSKIEWTEKIFVLVTAGCLLQYAGNGSYNRLPEKIMPLTLESAAFASDVIPGQPYVLQISQVLDDKGTVDKEISRSMLKKLGLRSELRRSTSTFLLVLESPEELSAWLEAVRKEVQAMGGKDYASEEIKKVNTDTAVNASVRQRPSQRYLVKRNPNQFGDLAPHSPPAVNSFDDNKMQERRKTDMELSLHVATNRQSMATQWSTDSRAVSNTSPSINQAYLDDLRESPRESYASAGAKTCTTSPEASPKLSPDKLSSDIPDMTSEHKEKRPLRSTYPGAKHASKQALIHTRIVRQESMQPDSSSLMAQHEAPISIPPQRRTSSPPAPNFSVPSFSKRYSTVNTIPADSFRSSKAQTPPISLQQAPSRPPATGDDSRSNDTSLATTSELQHPQKSTLRASKKHLKGDADPFLTPPQSSGPGDADMSEDGKERFSRRFSSLQYARGVSPVHLASQSPSPHPPPTAALPPLPGEKPLVQRASLIPPPATSLTPLFSASKTSQRYSMFPPASTRIESFGLRASSSHSEPSSTPLIGTVSKDYKKPAVTPTSLLEDDKYAPSTDKTAHGLGPVQRARASAKLRFLDPQNQSSVLKMEARNDACNVSSSQPSPLMTSFDEAGLTPPSEASPPKPSRAPPPAPTPSQQGRVHVPGRRSTPRIGREPPPVCSPTPSPKSKISVSSSAEGYFEGAAPHPCIPPIRVSERKFRGSLDGPWNCDYAAPQRTFLDLSAN